MQDEGCGNRLWHGALLFGAGMTLHSAPQSRGAERRSGSRILPTIRKPCQQSAMLTHFLKQLSPIHREIIDLVYYRGKSINEIIEILGIPRNTVKTRMFYARNAIAKHLKEFGIDREWAATPRRSIKPANPVFQ